MRITQYLLAAALGAACALALNAQAPSRSFVIHDIRGFDGAHTLEHKDVVVADGIIKSVKKTGGDGAPSSKGALAISGEIKSDFQADGKGLQAVLFSGSTTLGPFAFQIDDVQLVKP